MNTTLQLKSGYASLLGVPASAFDAPGFLFEIVEKRSNVAWGGNWFQPVWLIRLFQTAVCTVAAEYAQPAKKIFGACPYPSLLSTQLLMEAQNGLGADGWQALEILYYPAASLPEEDTSLRVCKLDREHPAYQAYAQEFSGGTYGIVDRDQHAVMI